MRDKQASWFLNSSICKYRSPQYNANSKRIFDQDHLKWRIDSDLSFPYHAPLTVNQSCGQISRLRSNDNNLSLPLSFFFLVLLLFRLMVWVLQGSQNILWYMRMTWMDDICTIPSLIDVLLWKFKRSYSMPSVSEDITTMRLMIPWLSIQNDIIYGAKYGLRSSQLATRQALVPSVGSGVVRWNIFLILPCSTITFGVGPHCCNKWTIPLASPLPWKTSPG